MCMYVSRSVKSKSVRITEYLEQEVELARICLASSDDKIALLINYTISTHTPFPQRQDSQRCSVPPRTSRSGSFLSSTLV